MKKFRNYSLMMLLLAGGMTLASCSNEEDENMVANAEATFSAEYPEFLSDDGTRTTIDPVSHRTMWRENDFLNLYMDKGNPEGYVLQTDNNNGTQKIVGFSFVNNREKEAFYAARENPTGNGRVIAVHGPRGTMYNPDYDRVDVRMGFGPGLGHMNKQPMLRNNMCSDADLLVSNSVNAASIKDSDNRLYFNRKTTLLQISIKYDKNNANAKKFFEEAIRTDDGNIIPFRAVKGFLTTGDMSKDWKALPEDAIYRDNNFAGKAYFALGENEPWQELIKIPGAGSGIEFSVDPSNKEKFFYEPATDDLMYVSVLPTKFNAEDKISFILGDGNGNIVKKVIKFARPFNFKEGYRYTLNINVVDGDFEFAE